MFFHAKKQILSIVRGARGARGGYKIIIKLFRRFAAC